MIKLPVHDGVYRAEEDGEGLVVEGEDDGGLGQILQVPARGLAPLVPAVILFRKIQNM